MGGFEFCTATHLQEALSILRRLDVQACVVAGGTDVARRIRSGELRPELLLDISHIGELRGIREEDGYIHIGALTRIAQLADVADSLIPALVTTAAGLLVAIPSFAAFNVLVVKIDRLVVDMEHAASEIVQFLDTLRATGSR